MRGRGRGRISGQSVARARLLTGGSRMSRRVFITDKELSAVLGVSMRTFRRMLRRTHGKRLDTDLLRPLLVGGARRWRVSEVAAAVGATADEIQERVS